ncbi:hypothetical protein [Mucilaginibacter gotjawali]|uniref:Uncharacterized protein n=2 Tax=Mucilaginibacter gotjawali TaxID=1550579 RepID=A0A0X8X299_9SPHI|nr:hypothetical protein [Mucilaginibacter gotjawali]MBB3058784.1 hypothetical protein [Mucilaginibacter gotjawali]BAU53837.1 hypothetical protein MgSA37_02008 [Mucilaginibacter gotjawali]
MIHKFHIPVLGLGYSVDTPLKVARYGISSVVSVVDDELIERMREYHAKKNNEPYEAITKAEPGFREKRITSYLNLLEKLVNQQFEQLKNEPFEPGSDICRYFELLPEASPLKQGYDLMQEYTDEETRRVFQNRLRNELKKGEIDVNIMSKVDKTNYTANHESTGEENTDALTALRGFAHSSLRSSVILSAGMNPRLYSYIESFADFLPDESGSTRKKVILKVSDFRSGLIQAKFLAKKGLWISEFRIESGLNCGGHAFASDGYLLGPVLEEFKNKREALHLELFEMYKAALLTKGITITHIPQQRISVQGGIGTADENNFLLTYYQLDVTGWGSPFLLVPEATNVDEDTLKILENAGEDAFYVSNSSPLGILFNNFKGTTSEKQRLERISKGRPGSPCTKKYLVTNTEFTTEPICTASREYQNLKIKQLKTLDLSPEQYEEQVEAVTEKICLCEGLCSSSYLKYGISKPKENKAVTICPGPNLAYFSRSYSLDEMVKHIYGSIDLLQNVKRPHVFINELNLYIDHFQKEISAQVKNFTDKKQKYLLKFKTELETGIDYYKQLFPQITSQAQSLATILEDLYSAEKKLSGISL